MRQFDTDSDGTISFIEFKSMMKKMQCDLAKRQEDNSGGIKSFLRVFSRLKERDNGFVSRKLDVAFQISDIDRVVELSAHDNNTQAQAVGPELAQLTLAIYIKNFNAPLVITLAKPGHVQAWLEAIRVSRAWQVNKPKEGRISVNYCLDDLLSFRQSLPEDTTEMRESMNPNRMDSTLGAVAEDDNSEVGKDRNVKKGNKEEKKQTVSSALTQEEVRENKAWQMRYMCDDAYSRYYEPVWWERKEMSSLVDFLKLKDPNDHPEFLVRSIASQMTFRRTATVPALTSPSFCHFQKMIS